MPDNDVLETDVIETPDTDDAEKDTDKDTKPAAEPITDPIEELAKEMDWVPKDEYDGDNWVDARTYLKNANIIAKKQRVTIGRLENSLDTLKRDVRKTIENQNIMAKKEIEKLKNELKQKKREIIAEGDPDAVDKIEKIDEQIENLNEEIEETVDTKQPDPAYTEWLEKNSWYDKTSKDYNQELQELADDIAVDYENTQIPLRQIFRIIDREIKHYKREKEIENPTKNEPMKKNTQRTQTDVIDTRHTSVKPSKKTAKDLPNEEIIDVGKRFVKDGLFKNLDEFAEDFFKLQETVI